MSNLLPPGDVGPMGNCGPVGPHQAFSPWTRAPPAPFASAASTGLKRHRPRSARCQLASPTHHTLTVLSHTIPILPIMFTSLFFTSALAAAALAHPHIAVRHGDHAHAHAVERQLPSAWYQRDDHFAHKLFTRDDATATTEAAGSPGSSGLGVLWYGP
jgi:hypothetical protein